MKKVIEKLDQEIEERDLGTPFFNNPEYHSFPLTKETFKAIKATELKGKVAYVDGGNQEILGAPNFSVQVNRVYYNVFRGQRRIETGSLPHRIEFFSVTCSRFNGNNIVYDTSVFPVQESFKDLLPREKDLSFDSFDRTVTLGTQRADIARVASIARRFAEWNYAKHVLDEVLEEGDVLVVDGTLQTAFTNEYRYTRDLYKLAQDRGVTVTGLSKTSHLFTDTGLSLIGAVVKLAKETGMEDEFYAKVAEARSSDHNAVIFVVKLHPKAERAFRYEIHRGQFMKLDEEVVGEIFFQLASNSRDIGFPGYPYGLVEADSFARVRESEVTSYQTLFLSQISKMGKWPKFARHIHAVDAHGYLNILVG